MSASSVAYHRIGRIARTRQGHYPLATTHAAPAATAATDTETRARSSGDALVCMGVLSSRTLGPCGSLRALISRGITRLYHATASASYAELMSHVQYGAILELAQAQMSRRSPELTASMPVVPIEHLPIRRGGRPRLLHLDTSDPTYREAHRRHRKVEPSPLKVFDRSLTTEWGTPQRIL